MKPLHQGPPGSVGWQSGLRRAAAIVFIVVYVATTLWFAGRSALGDWGSHPIAYWFTWDMFAFHYSESSRRVAVAETASGQYRQIIPSGILQYRGGVHGDLTRVDLERGGLFYHSLAEAAIREAPTDDPIRRVFLYERYWPPRFNYPDELHQVVWGGPRPERVFWRLREEFALGQKGDSSESGAAP